MDEGMEFYTGLPQWNAIMLLYDMFFGKARNGSYEKRKWAYQRNDFVGPKQGVQSMAHIPCSVLAFPGDELYHGRLFQLIFNFHMARRMHCVWFVSFFLSNNPKSASTPLAQAPTHAFEVNYGAPSPPTTLPSPFAN